MRVRADKRVSCCLLAAGLSLADARGAVAQSITPMRGEVRSFTEQAAVRVFPANPYEHRIKVEVRVYDETFAPIAANVVPEVALLAPLDSRSVTVVVPFEGRDQRKFRICAESVPFEQAPTQVRTQVCGRFVAQRLR